MGDEPAHGAAVNEGQTVVGQSYIINYGDDDGEEVWYKGIFGGEENGVNATYKYVNGIWNPVNENLPYDNIQEIFKDPNSEMVGGRRRKHKGRKHKKTTKRRKSKRRYTRRH